MCVGVYRYDDVACTLTTFLQSGILPLINFFARYKNLLARLHCGAVRLTENRFFF